MQQQQHSQRPEQITDADAFVAKVLAVQDPLRIDDDLEELRYVVFSGVANRLVKFSGLFNNQNVAIERAKKVAMDGLFTTAVAEVGKWAYFGTDLGKITTEQAVQRFVNITNDGIVAFEERMAAARNTKEETEEEELAEPMDVEAEKEPEPEPEPEAKEPEPEAGPDPDVLRRMKLAITRGDVKDDRIADQRFLVIGHGKINDDECLFRVVGSYETESEAERAAKKAFDIDSVDIVTKRFDYVVARQFVWHNFPINFARDVEKTTVDSNKDLEEYYKGEMYKRSDEYKMAVQEIEETSRQMKEEADKRALEEDDSSKKKSLAITNDEYLE